MKVVYPGTFDPITNGHLDIINRARNLFGELVIAVNNSHESKTTFTANERKEMVQETVKGMDGVEVEIFSELLAHYLKKKGCSIIIRGLRAISDFDYEFQMATINKAMEQGIETVFLMTDKDNFYLSSSVVKTIAGHRGDVSGLVPEPVADKIKEMF
jgi:pantetheine-phosphate adenylyltransferase